MKKKIEAITAIMKTIMVVIMVSRRVGHVIQSREMRAVTNARASGDYQPGNDDWDIGMTSIMMHALGLAPSKDNWWSTQFQSEPFFSPLISTDFFEPSSFALESLGCFFSVELKIFSILTKVNSCLCPIFLL